jgi:hypothetical protein
MTTHRATSPQASKPRLSASTSDTRGSVHHAGLRAPGPRDQADGAAFGDVVFGPGDDPEDDDERTPRVFDSKPRDIFRDLVRSRATNRKREVCS